MEKPSEIGSAALAEEADWIAKNECKTKTTFHTCPYVYRALKQVVDRVNAVQQQAYRATLSDLLELAAGNAQLSLLLDLAGTSLPPQVSSNMIATHAYARQVLDDIAAQEEQEESRLIVREGDAADDDDVLV